VARRNAAGRRSKNSKLADQFETVLQRAAGEDFGVRALEMGSARLELQIHYTMQVKSLRFS
jgi:hypothetical protein